MNPKDWRKKLAKLPDTEFTTEQFISNLLEAVAVACEGEKGKHKECYLDHCDRCEATRGFDAGLDTAANLIRSLKGDE